jgi:uncharacterized phage-associated protein
MGKIVNISDYIIFRIKSEGDMDLNTLKHQKLLFYVQAWYLAFFEQPLFEEDFQAWIHGPVNREIYDLYKDNKNLYSELTIEDCKEIGAIVLTDAEKSHIDIILDNYAKYSSTQLEYMTHNELPWIEARQGVSPYERCENIISKETMKNYYKERLS